MAVYDRIFDGEDSEIRAFIAYVLYERARREWVEEFQRERNGAPGEVEQRAYDATWTPQLIQNARNSADSILAEYADSAVTAARPAIVEEALKGQAWK